MRHHVDVHVGKRIRYARWVANITQQQLAAAVGVRFQQIQKYETGMNRVSASRLYDIAQNLNVSPAYFFEELETDSRPGTDAAGSAGATLSRAEKAVPADLFSDKEALDFLKCYYALADEPRRHLLDLTRTMADAA